MSRRHKSVLRPSYIHLKGLLDAHYDSLSIADIIWAMELVQEAFEDPSQIVYTKLGFNRGDIESLWSQGILPPNCLRFCVQMVYDSVHLLHTRCGGCAREIHDAVLPHLVRLAFLEGSGVRPEPCYTDTLHNCEELLRHLPEDDPLLCAVCFTIENWEEISKKISPRFLQDFLSHLESRCKEQELSRSWPSAPRPLWKKKPGRRMSSVL